MQGLHLEIHGGMGLLTLPIYACHMEEGFVGILPWVLFVLNMESQFSEDPENESLFLTSQWDPSFDRIGKTMA